MSFSHHFVSVVSSVNFSHFDLLKNHWVKLNQTLMWYCLNALVRITRQHFVICISNWVKTMIWFEGALIWSRGWAVPAFWLNLVSIHPVVLKKIFKDYQFFKQSENYAVFCTMPSIPLQYVLTHGQAVQLPGGPRA
jgi:hypothetical protein